MKKLTTIALALALSLIVAACDSEDAQVTTTTADASQLTTTTTVPITVDTSSDTTDQPEATGTTVDPGDQVETWEIISRTSTEEEETLYILVPPGNYTDVSFENFLVTLLEDETAVSGVEVFDDRTALDAALAEEAERTADDLQAIEDHHLVSLTNGREVQFQGPMADIYDGFIIGS